MVSGMALRMHVDVVSAERLIFTGQAQQVHIRGEVGEGMQQDMQATIHVSNPALGQFFQSHTQFHLRITPGLLSVRSPPEAHRPASPALRHLKNILIVPDNFAATDRLHHFFLRASLKHGLVEL